MKTGKTEKTSDLNTEEMLFETSPVSEYEEKNKPCWKNYYMLGWKKKKNKKVPNCVPKKNKKSK